MVTALLFLKSLLDAQIYEITVPVSLNLEIGLRRLLLYPMTLETPVLHILTSYTSTTPS